MEVPVGMSAMQLGQHLGRVGQAAHFALNGVYLEGRMTRDGQFDHLDTLLEARDGVVLLVWRIAGRHKPHLVQPAPLTTLLRQNEMAEMDRIEGAAEDTDAPH